MKKIKFWLDGCDINFLAEAPEDITLKQLLKQCNRIEPHWCCCGINSKNIEDVNKVEIIIDYDNIKKVNDDVSCDILESTEKDKMNDENPDDEMNNENNDEKMYDEVASIIRETIELDNEYLVSVNDIMKTIKVLYERNTKMIKLLKEIIENESYI